MLIYSTQDFYQTGSVLLWFCNAICIDFHLQCFKSYTIFHIYSVLKVTGKMCKMFHRVHKKDLRVLL